MVRVQGSLRTYALVVAFAISVGVPALVLGDVEPVRSPCEAYTPCPNNPDLVPVPVEDLRRAVESDRKLAACTEYVETLETEHEKTLSEYAAVKEANDHNAAQVTSLQETVRAQARSIRILTVVAGASAGVAAGSIIALVLVAVFGG